RGGGEGCGYAASLGQRKRVAHIPTAEAARSGLILEGQGQARLHLKSNPPWSHQWGPVQIDPASFKTNVETATGGRVEVDAEAGVIRARGALNNYDLDAMLSAMPNAAAKAVHALVHKSRGARLKAVDPAETAIRFAVPRLTVRSPKGLELFDRTHFLDIPWKLEESDPKPILDFFAPPRPGVDEAHLDVSAAGKVTVDFVTDLHQQLALTLEEKGWTKTALVNWIDRRLSTLARRDITRVSSTLFITKALDVISERTGMTLEALARAKFRL